MHHPVLHLTASLNNWHPQRHLDGHRLSLWRSLDTMLSRKPSLSHKTRAVPLWASGLLASLCLSVCGPVCLSHVDQTSPRAGPMSRALLGSCCGRGSSKGLWIEWTTASGVQASERQSTSQPHQTGPRPGGLRVGGSETGILDPTTLIPMILCKSPTLNFPTQSTP